MTNVLRRRAVSLLLSLGLAIASLACFAFPLYVIRPFRSQGPRELALALLVARFGPAVSIVCAVLGIALAWFVSATFSRKLPRFTAVLFSLLAIGGAFLARIDVYELMFHPIDSPQFAVADKVKVDLDDMVIAVKVNGARRAYPIREMAYHHIVNDTLGGEPIAATY
jgi:hypothetical protein